MTQWRLEPGTDFDTEAIMALLAEVFAEYDCQLDPVLDTPEHYQPQTRYWDQGGAFFVARSTDNTLLGTVAVHPSDTPHTAQIRTMYVARSWRGRGIAQDLMRSVLTWCNDHTWTRLELWSDTRFTRGHAFYSRLGFIRTGRVRQLDDINNTHEYHFEAPIAALTVAS